ncbi:MAG TPA: DNA-3-methyladenine glycosylase [Gemmatimonadaceae bacterium]|nr:DNA-3-methyladenine glycosylase [Gemmatimonadaceae bacterium]
MHHLALRHLRAADPALGRVIARVGPYALAPRTDGTHFDYVVRCIIGQQLSGKAAQTIYQRVLALYGGRAPTPAELAKTSDPKLRAAGLSGRKSEYVRELAAHAARRTIAIERLHEMSDDDVMATLVSVRGIGRWTAQMVLMFRLGRPDVLPELDLGVQKAVQRLYRLRALPTPEKLQKLGAKWAPWRTIASWYLWRSLELPKARA